MLRNKIYKLLRKSEKYTKTDMVYLTKGGFWISFSKITASLSAFVLAIAYANLLPVETYATYKYILSITGLLVIPTLTGINTTLVRSVAMGFEGNYKISFQTKLRWGILSTLIGIFVAGYYFLIGNKILSYGFLIASIFIPLIQVASLYSYYLQGKKLFKKASIFNTLNNLLITSLVIVVMFNTKNIITIILAYYLGTLIVYSLLSYYTLRKNKLDKKEDLESIKLGKHLSVMNILGAIASQIDKILMWHLLGPMALAVYSFATIPVEQIRNFLKSSQQLALPKLGSHDVDTIKKTLPEKIFKFAVLILPIIIIYYLASPWLFKIFFSAYTDSINYSQIFSISLLFFPFGLINSALTAKANKKSLYLINSIAPIIRILSMTIFIPIWGIMGAISAFICSKIINSIIAIIILQKTK